MHTTTIKESVQTMPDTRIRFRCDAPSDKRQLDSLVQRIVAFLNGQNMVKPPGLTLVSRELILNAIVHGNEGNTNCRVSVETIITGPDSFRIVVEDEGPGFDYTMLQVELPDARLLADRRGYMLIHALTDRVEFNEEGNRVTVHFDGKERRENES